MSTVWINIQYANQYANGRVFGWFFCRLCSSHGCHDDLFCIASPPHIADDDRLLVMMVENPDKQRRESTRPVQTKQPSRRRFQLCLPLLLLLMSLLLFVYLFARFRDPYCESSHFYWAKLKWGGGERPWWSEGGSLTFSIMIIKDKYCIISCKRLSK